MLCQALYLPFSCFYSTLHHHQIRTPTSGVLKGLITHPQSQPGKSRTGMCTQALSPPEPTEFPPHNITFLPCCWSGVFKLLDPNHSNWYTSRHNPGHTRTHVTNKVSQNPTLTLATDNMLWWGLVYSASWPRMLSPNKPTSRNLSYRYTHIYMKCEWTRLFYYKRKRLNDPRIQQQGTHHSHTVECYKAK